MKSGSGLACRTVVACRAPLLLLLGSSTGAFALDAASLHGIWKGTLGTQEVTLCLAASAADYCCYDRLWNRTSGVKIDSLWDWFLPGERILHRDHAPLRAVVGPRLAVILSKANPAPDVAADPSCNASTLTYDGLDVDLDEDGFVFWIAPRGTCELRVADADVEPLLTDRGRSDLHSIRADLRRGPRR